MLQLRGLEISLKIILCFNENHFISRLHKIGKNPGMVAPRTTLDSDWKQISDIVSALSAAECDSVQSTWNQVLSYAQRR